MKTKEQLEESLRELTAEYEEAIRPDNKMLENSYVYKSYLVDLSEDIMFIKEQLKQYGD